MIGHLSPCTKLRSKWIKDININPTTLNLIEEKVGSSLQDIGTGDHFLSRSPGVQTIRETINKWDLLKLRCFFKAKNTISKAKRLPYEHLIFDKGAKGIQWKKESIFNKWCWHNWMSTCRRMKVDPSLSPCTKLKSKF